MNILDLKIETPYGVKPIRELIIEESEEVEIIWSKNCSGDLNDFLGDD